MKFKRFKNFSSRFLSLLTVSAVGISQFANSALANESFKSSPDQEILIQKDAYIIGPGDVIDLKFFDAPEFSGTYTVLKDGNINLPLVGTLNIDKLTLDQATSFIQNKYKTELLRPELHLTIRLPRPIRVSIIGEIERPGIYSLTAKEEEIVTEGGLITLSSGIPTLVDAFQKAGGITQNANLEEIKLIRKLPGNNDKSKIAKINLLNLILKGDQEQNPFLYDGDIIKISKVDKLPAETMSLAQANLSPQKINISVIGQVINPGQLEVNANTPLVQAVLMAGGPIAWDTNTGNIELIRINKNGSAFRKRYKLNLSEGASSQNNPPLMNRDVIYVRSTILNKVSTGVEKVTQPLSGLISVFTLLKLVED